MPDLELLDVKDAADVLDMSPQLLSRYHSETHSLIMPGGRRQYPNHYVGALAESPEWNERQTQVEGLALFAGSVVAMNAVMTSEWQHESRIITALARNQDGMLTNNDLARVFEVLPTSASRWLAKGYVSPPTLNRHGHQAVHLSDLRQAYSWQRPTSYPAVKVTTATTQAELGHYRPPVRYELPVARFRNVADQLGVSHDTMAQMSRKLHRLIPPGRIAQYPTSYVQALAENPDWTTERPAKSLRAANQFAITDIARQTMDEIEQNHTRAIDEAFEETDGTLPRYMVGQLLGASYDTVTNWYKDGRIDAALPMNREHFDMLYRWERPTAD